MRNMYMLGWGLLAVVASVSAFLVLSPVALVAANVFGNLALVLSGGR